MSAYRRYPQPSRHHTPMKYLLIPIGNFLTLIFMTLVAALFTAIAWPLAVLWHFDFKKANNEVTWMWS